MRILLLTQVVPFPPDSGPKIKTYNLLRYLVRSHEVHLVSFARSRTEESNARSLKSLCHSVTTVPMKRSRLRDVGYLTRSSITGRPFLIERDDSAAMRRSISRMLAQYDFDAVHADQLSMAQFAISLPVPLRVLDEHNAVWTIVQRAAKHESSLPRRIAAEVEWRKLRSYEGYVCRQFDVVTVVSNQDCLALAEAAQAVFPTRVIPIAVDCSEMAFVERPSEAKCILSMATMFYPPNIEGVHWFAKEVFPRVRVSLSDARFLVVGSRPPEQITSLATAGSGIEVTGYVDDLAPVLQGSGVMVVPVRSGSGMRVKILEAFSRGIPVVSTTVGIEGIDAKNNEHLLVADGPAEFADAVVHVLTQRDKALRLAREARCLVERSYDWRSALQPLDGVYRPTPLCPPVAQISPSNSGAPTAESTLLAR